MKKYVCILLSVFLIAALCACVHSPDFEDHTDPTKASTAFTKPAESTIPSESTLHTEPAVPTVPETEPVVVDCLSLDKDWVVNYEDGKDYTLLVRSEYSYVTMSESDTDQYSVVAHKLDEIADMLRRNMEEEFDNLVSFAVDEYAQEPYGFTTYVSTMNVQVRRADSIAVSLLSDSYADFLGIDGFRALTGSTFDTQTGQPLMLSDVIRDMEALPALVQQELEEYAFTVMMVSESAVSDYFRDTPEDGIRWTLDYNGVTFYFVSGELTEPGSGSQNVTLTFTEYPQLFYEKYTAVPEEYSVELTNNTAFYADLDGDGVCEALMFSAWYDEERNHYLDYGIYSGETFFFEDCYQYHFYPFYVKKNDGHYLYLYCEFLEEGYRDMGLKIFRLEKDNFSKLEEHESILIFSNTGAIQLPTDPTHLQITP